jgi:CheY-like chemotaxis protein
MLHTAQQLIDILVQLDRTIRQTATKELYAKKNQFLGLLAKLGHAGAALTLADSYNPALSQTPSFSYPDKTLALYYYQMAIKQSVHLLFAIIFMNTKMPVMYGLPATQAISVAAFFVRYLN